MPKSLPEIVKCKCGSHAHIDTTNFSRGFMFIECDKYCGWRGGLRVFERGAINAWNKVMKKPDAIVKYVYSESRKM